GLCVRGRFGFQYIDSKERLGAPLVRTEEGFAPRSWFEVMATVVGRLKALKAQHGPNAIAGLITARCTHEELYLFQKLIRGAIVAASRLTNIAKLASHPLPIAAGSERWFIQALVKAAVEEDLVDEAATTAAPEAFVALKAAVAGLSWEVLTARTGTSREVVIEA